MRKELMILAAVIIAAFFLLPQWLFTLNEKEQAIITQFGEYIRTVKEPGLHTKTPFLQKVHRFEKRVLATDAKPAEYLTLDKKRLVVDHIARWKIEEPIQFFKSVATVYGAKARIEDIVFSEMRSELASHQLVDIIASEREPIMETVAKSARKKIGEYGIDLIDVRIKRADLPKEVQESVFARMVAERNRIAKRYRSQGREEAAKIRAEADKKTEIILANAYAKSQELRGEGDAEAASIYAEAFDQNPEFYSFLRTLEAYNSAVTSDTLFVIPSDSDFFKYMNGGMSK